MTTYLFDTPPQSAVPIKGRSELFAVRRIYCCAQNYAAHEKEMGSAPEREKPFGFLKPADALLIVRTGETGVMPFPTASANLHHELELVVALGRGGKNLSTEQAEACIVGYAVGLDMTCRDLQNEAKSKGRPWDSAKGFDFSAPISEIVLRESGTAGPTEGDISLMVNDKPRQKGDLSDMIWTPAEIIAWFSKIWEFKAGDLVFTGTPQGVGPVVAGDVMEGHIAGVGTLRVKVA